MAIWDPDLSGAMPFSIGYRVIGNVRGDDAMFDRIAGEIRNGVQVEISGEGRLIKLHRFYGNVQY